MSRATCCISILPGQLRHVSPEWCIRDCAAISALWLQTCQGVSDTSENESTFSDTTKTKAKQPENWSFLNHEEKWKNSQLLDTGLCDTSLFCCNWCVYTHASLELNYTWHYILVLGDLPSVGFALIVSIRVPLKHRLKPSLLLLLLSLKFRICHKGNLWGRNTRERLWSHLWFSLSHSYSIWWGTYRQVTPSCYQCHRQVDCFLILPFPNVSTGTGKEYWD